MNKVYTSQAYGNDKWEYKIISYVMNDENLLVALAKEGISGWQVITLERAPSEVGVKVWFKRKYTIPGGQCQLGDDRK
jgi:hypothetical protein